MQGQLQRSKRTVALRGLNQNHYHDLKSIFKGAATKAGSAKGPFHDFYSALLAQGMKPTMARLTLARKIATHHFAGLEERSVLRRPTAKAASVGLNVSAKSPFPLPGSCLVMSS